MQCCPKYLSKQTALNKHEPFKELTVLNEECIIIYFSSKSSFEKKYALFF